MTDYSIASKIVPPTFDPLKIVGQAQDVQKGQLQNKLLGQNIAQTLAQRAAAQGAIDENGNYDTKKYTNALASGGASPEALLQAQQTQEAQLRAQLTGQNLSQEQIKTSVAKLGQIGDVAGQLLINADKTPLTRETVSGAIDNLYKTGVLTEQDKPYEQQFLAGVSDDPQKNANLLRNIYARTHANSEGMAFLRGQLGTQDVGPAVLTTQTSGLPPEAGGGQSVVAALGKGLSPSEAQTPAYQYTDPDTGQTHIVTKMEAAKAAAGGAQPGSPPKGIVSGMKIGDPERAGQGVKFENDLTTAAHAWGDVHGTLSNFSGLVNQLASGPKAGAIKTLGQIATQFGFAPPSVKNDAAALEEAGKLAYQIAQRQFQQLGGTGTDSKLDSAMHTSPSEFLTQLGNKRIIPLLQGNNDAIKAQQEAYQTWKQAHGPQEYSQFVSQWNQHYDPRVFQAAYMDPPEVAKLKAGMTKAERANFDAFSAFAKSKGWLNGGQ